MDLGIHSCDGIARLLGCWLLVKETILSSVPMPVLTNWHQKAGIELQVQMVEWRWTRRLPAAIKRDGIKTRY